MRRLHLLIMTLFVAGSAYAADESLPPAQKTGSWRATVKESEQTLDAFLAEKPRHVVPNDVIYLMPIGKFNKQQRRLIGGVSEYLQAKFGISVQIMPDVAFVTVSQEGARKNPITGQFQVSAPYVIENVIERNSPHVYASVVGVTAQDIFPGNETNYVMGLATPETRVALVSTARMWEGDVDDAQALARFKKLVAHECLHTFALAHETLHKCLMNGYNSISELDALPDTCSSVSRSKAQAVGIGC